MAIVDLEPNLEALSRREAVRTDPVERYRMMVTIRRAEAQIREFHSSGQAWGTTHCADGQEAVAVGLAAAARPTDQLWIAHRVHGLGLAMGCSLESVFAENLGRSTGSVGGLGGSFHLTEISVGLIHSFTIIGTQMAQVVGAAYAAQVKGTDNVAIAQFGDGAVNIGVFHESLNLAKLWNVPAVFLLENNQYAEFTHVDKMTSISPLARRGDAYDMPWDVVDGQDVDQVIERISVAIERARSGGGPTLVELETYRYLGHSRSDLATYREEGEFEKWYERDPIVNNRDRLITNGLATSDELDIVEAEIDVAIAQAATAALNAEPPKLSAMFAHVEAPAQTS